MGRIQGASSPFPLWFSHFPVTHTFIELPGSKIRHAPKNNCGMCPTVLTSFITLMAYLLWQYSVPLSIQFFLKDWGPDVYIYVAHSL